MKQEVFKKQVEDVALIVHPHLEEKIEGGINNTSAQSDVSSSFFPSKKELRRAIRLAKQLIKRLEEK